MNPLPPLPQSYWTASTDAPEYPRLDRDTDADVVIAGAGITGITCGYLLAKAGLKVVILEAGRALHGTTGHTTAKITAQHGLIYDELIGSFGEDAARLYYEANREAGEWIRGTIEAEGIDCAWAPETAYLFAQSVDTVPKLEREQRAYETLGIDGRLTDRSGELPVNVAAALAMPGQARFHPLAYLTALLRRFVGMGGRLYEHTTVMAAEDGESPVVVTEAGHRVRCRYVVSASHFPFYQWKGFYFARMHAERSYVLAVRLGQRYAGGMHLSADKPKRSIRLAEEGEEPLVLIGGAGHSAASQPTCMIDRYEELQQFAHSTFDVKEIAYRWSTQDLVTLDKVPYVGAVDARTERLLVATGYRKWGMTGGTAAARLLANIVQEQPDRFRELYAPSRFHAGADSPRFVSDNAAVAMHLVAGKLEIAHRHPDELSPGEGGVVRANGRRAGGYRDPQGTLHLVDTTCTHMGCETHWNDGDRTWDCPCHGSRFTFKGEVVEGPAKEPLGRIDSR